MPENKDDPFGEYASEPETTGMPPVGEAAEPDEIESVKYGVGKPRRIRVRGTVAADTGTKGR